MPSYNAYYWIYWAQRRKDQFQGGARHELMAHYYHDLPTFIPGAKAQYIGLTGSMNYHDGAFGVRPGWSHAVAQLGTSVHALGCVLTFAINRQWSIAKEVISGSETWSTVSLAKNF